jgi:hypothetical protein
VADRPGLPALLARILRRALRTGVIDARPTVARGVLRPKTLPLRDHLTMRARQSA